MAITINDTEYNETKFDEVLKKLEEPKEKIKE